DIGSLALTAVMLDADLRKLALPAAFRLLEAKHFARVEQADGFRRGRQSRCDGLRYQRRKLGTQCKDVALAIDEPVNLFLWTRSHALNENVVVIEDRRNDFLVRPALEDRTNRALENAPVLRRAPDEDLCPRRNLGVRLHALSNQSFFVHQLCIQ